MKSTLVKKTSFRLVNKWVNLMKCPHFGFYYSLSNIGWLESCMRYSPINEVSLPGLLLPRRFKDTSRGVMVSKVDLQTYTSEFETHWVPHPFGLVPNRSKELRRLLPRRFWGCPRGVMVKAMNYGIVVREFVLQSRYYVHFRANTLGEGMNPLILPPAMGK